jgi:hypothetical protein
MALLTHHFLTCPLALALFAASPVALAAEPFATIPSAGFYGGPGANFSEQFTYGSSPIEYSETTTLDTTYIQFGSSSVSPIPVALSTQTVIQQPELNHPSQTSGSSAATTYFFAVRGPDSNQIPLQLSVNLLLDFQISSQSNVVSFISTAYYLREFTSPTNLAVGSFRQLASGGANICQAGYYAPSVLGSCLTPQSHSEENRTVAFNANTNYLYQISINAYGLSGIFGTAKSMTTATVNFSPSFIDAAYYIEFSSGIAATSPVPEVSTQACAVVGFSTLAFRFLIARNRSRNANLKTSPSKKKYRPHRVDA